MQEPSPRKNALPDALYDLQVWDQLSLEECTEIAFQFENVETYMAGNQRHQIAHFTWRSPAEPEPCSFVLIPGSCATLGYDRSLQLEPSAALMYEWWKPDSDEDERLIAANEEAFCALLPSLYAQLHQHMDEVLSPLRVVTIQPFLLEVTARPASQLVAKVVGQYRYHVGRRTKRKSLYKGWPPEFPSSLAARLIDQSGFRFPTSDEWEYACAAGSRTLFYWGDTPFAEDKWAYLCTGKARAAFDWGGNSPLDESAYRDVPLNAFGLAMVTNPYFCEWCAESEMMRGGDGGCTICGVMGGWLFLSHVHLLISIVLAVKNIIR